MPICVIINNKYVYLKESAKVSKNQGSEAALSAARLRLRLNPNLRLRLRLRLLKVMEVAEAESG